MDATVGRSRVAGTARAPASKSYTHRAILAGGFADRARVAEPLLSEDPRATIRAVEAFGGAVEIGDGELAVEGFDGHPTAPDGPIDCANSGTTLRLATATAALADGETELTGDASLRSRPQGPLLAAIESLGGRAESHDRDGTAPLTVEGPIEGGRVSIPGDVSSQFVTALLLAGAATPEGIQVALETELKSAPYVEVTREVLDAFGVRTEVTPEGFAVDGGQAYRRVDEPYDVPGDFSSIGYLLAAGALAGEGAVRVEGAAPSAQGDAAVIDHLRAMGAPVTWDREAGAVTVEPAPLDGVEISVEDTPDLLPTLAVLGAAADGTTRLTDAEHVRYKETDRVAVMAAELAKLGASVEERPDELLVHGGESELIGASVDGHGDHRVVMSLAVAGLVASGETTIGGAEHAGVSFPEFFGVLEGLGAAVSLE
ncbi:MAG: 3-phosphoshikimate 1-carboxyvinyltransferase [Halobacteriales archaeon]|nr:3-phosphoshikimate 1-carboxyvinyltransferase [Halobacteriales archaeon]